MSVKTFDYSQTKPKGRITRGKAIRIFCVQCMAGQVHGVRDCSDPDCSLYRFRLGREDRKT